MAWVIHFRVPDRVALVRTEPIFRETIMMIKVRSLRRFILLTTLSLVVGGGLITAFANYGDAQEQIEELFDAELAQMARVLQSVFNNPSYQLPAFTEPLIYEDFADLSSSANDDEEYEHEIMLSGHKYEKKLAFQVWGKNEKLLIQSRTAAEHRLPKSSAGFHTIKEGGALWRVFALYDEGNGISVQVAQREDVRSELTLGIAEHLFMLPLMVLPILALAIWYFVGVAVAPLRNISEEVSQRHMGNLAAIDANNVPVEITGLVESLNLLFGRVKSQALMERRFTADAAHELRTPLAAIKIQLQNALRRIDGGPAKDSMIKSLSALNRMIHLVEQLLLLNRLDSTKVIENSEPVVVASTIHTVIDEYAEQISDRGIQLIQLIDETIVVDAHPALLYSLVRNFIDNALRYTPDRGSISIALADGQLKIEDSGSGVPEDQMETVFQRFYRVEGDSSQGAGLGLAICRQITSLYGFDLRIKNCTLPVHGLQVTIGFTKSHFAENA